MRERRSGAGGRGREKEREGGKRERGGARGREKGFATVKGHKPIHNKFTYV